MKISGKITGESGTVIFNFLLKLVKMTGKETGERFLAPSQIGGLLVKSPQS